ncbi:SpoIVB peptidase S55 domain-containing protein [Nocardioides cynanchi]|uniref:SpoIVB peptidase S55 domain-containing protein n=1 Tax=Nocardioides cynanchi TaxID=2558918 RepID=UPI001248818B|nr:SpoIVB peptidase S55 domain-containing protein [Nocardioides cynanchi]
MTRPTSRTRVLASAAVATGLCLGAATAVQAPSQAASGTCDTAYPVSQLTTGQAVTGLTVSSGTTPSGFSGTVLGVLKDGIEPGVDMIMMRLTSTEIDRVGGIWEGMSGSPVYASDGRLIGAVAYGLAYGTTPVAGITPYEDMDQYAGTPPTPLRVGVPSSAARAIARSTDVTTAQAHQGFAELKVPTGISGLSPRVLARDTGRPYLKSHTYVAGRSGSSASPGVGDMISGGNLVATLSTGDVLQGAVGTITSVCNGTVVGFGHPLNFVGKASYGMAGGDAIYIQEDPVNVPFKVANIGDLLGTVDQDRMTGIAGLLGATPPSLPIQSKVTYTPDGGVARSRTGSSDVQLQDAAAATANYELILNHQAVMDAYQPGSETQSWTVTGSSASGPFTFTGGNRYTDGFDLTFASVWDLPDLVWLLSNVDGVTIDSVKVSSNVTDSTATKKIAGLQQRRAGAWHTVTAGAPALVRAGGTLTARVVYAGGTTGRTFTVAVPARAAGMRGQMTVAAAQGFPFEQFPMPKTIGGVKKLVDGAVRNDQATVELSAFGGKTRPVQVHTTTPKDHEVITGHHTFKVKVL